MNFQNIITAIVLTASTTLAANDKPQVEILHWWSSPGESAALNVLINAFESRGGHYYDSTTDNELANRQEAIERMGKGYPSTLTQWNAGREIREFYEFGLTNAITDPKLIDKLKSSLPKPILDAVRFQGEIIAMPINIHAENWMWYSTDVLRYKDDIMSNNWQQFIDQGKELAKQNIPLLAVGDQPWQVRILFTSLFLDISRDLYMDFYLEPEKSAATTDTREFRRVLEVFNQIASYSKSFGDGNWNTQVKALADNKAGATFMGDWAKGEFQSLGKIPGRDFGCKLTAADDPSLLLVIDTFILGKTTDPQDQAGQALMLDVISDPEVNKKFNQLKGSVTPYTRPSDDELDICSEQVYETLTKPDSIVPPYQSYRSGQSMQKIDNEIYRFWKASQESQSDAEETIQTSLDNFKKIMTEINTSTAEPLATNEE